MLCSFYIRFLIFCSIVLFIPFFGNSQHIFNQYSPSNKIKQESFQFVSHADYYNINIGQLSSSLNNSGPIEIAIPIGNRSKTVILEKTNILTPEYRLYTSSGKTIKTSNKYIFYHGKVQFQPNSKVTLTFYDDKLSISIFDKDGNYEINKHSNFYAGYYNHNRKTPIDTDWECKVLNEPSVIHKPNNSDSRFNMTPECVTTFLEIDHNMYNKQGGNINNAESWAMTLFSQIAIMYMEHNVPINISGIQVWDTPDPYISATNTSGALSLFRNAVHNNPNFNGRLAHLLSGRSLGGGIAYLNSLCSNSTNVAVSANMNSGNVPFPSYSWNVMVVAHELGHNMGSPHTQSCSWNGNNTAIDGCGSIEGSCADPGNPPNNVGGTIMSYCHLTSAGINFNNGFGPQPGALINEKYINASCITGENCSYVSPYNDICNRAKELPVLNYCVNGYFENYAVTSSGDGGNFSCGNTGVEKDIWFEFEYLDVDSVNINVQATNIITDLVVEVYSGACNSLTSIDCGFSTNGSSVNFALEDPSLIGETIYIRIVEDGSDEEGEFSICLFSEELPCQIQIDTILNIYEDLNGSSWTINQGWENGFLNGSCDYCNWQGITCNYKGEIIEIDLSNNNLQGTLPLDFAALIELRKLNLSTNVIIDTIPDYWDSLDHLLLLDLSYNSLQGTVPKSFTTMTRINKTYLDFNMLDSLPTGLGYNSSLRTFTASNNLLEGCFVNGISSFCYKDSINLDNNIGLPYGGDVTLLCENGWGTDWDMDGYCSEIEDCNDYNDEINPSADEILCDAIDNNCNGSIDEGSDFGPNIWIGPDSLGIFDDPINWSLGHVPLICENIEIGTNQDTIELILLGNSQGGGQGGYTGGFGNLEIRNLTIGTNTTIYLGDTTNLSIVGNGIIENNGTFFSYGYFNIRDQKGTTNTAFINNGSFSVLGFGGFSIQEVGEYGVYNTANGTMELEGYSNINIYNNELAKKAILNEGSISVFGNLTISGEYMEESIKNENGGVIEVKNGGDISVYE